MANLPTAHHRDVGLAQRGDQPFQPVFIGGNGVRRKDGDKSPLRFAQSHVQRITEREVLGTHSDDPGAARRRNLARSIHRSGIHDQHLEVPIGLPVECRKHLREPALLVQGPDDDAGLWQVDFCHGFTVGRGQVIGWDNSIR